MSKNDLTRRQADSLGRTSFARVPGLRSHLPDARFHDDRESDPTRRRVRNRSPATRDLLKVIQVPRVFDRRQPEP